MLNKYTKNKDIFNFCLKYASTQTKSKAPTEIYFTFLKLAAAGDFEEKMLNLTESRIQETLGYCRNPEQYEKSKKYLRKDLESGLEAMAIYIRLKAKTESIADFATKYLYEKFIDNTIENILPKYIFDKSKKFELKGALNGLLNSAYKNTKLLETSRSQEAKLNRATQSIQEKEEQFGAQLTAPSTEGQLDDKFKKSTEDNITELKNIFYSIMKDPKQDVLSYYIEEGLLPKFKALQKKYFVADTPQEKSSAEEDLREFYNYAQGFIGKNFNARIKNPKTGKPHNLSQFELQNILNAAVEKLNLEDLSERIIKQEFHQLPLRLRRLVDEHPEFVKAAIQSLIKTKLIYNTKDELDAPLASAEGASQKTTIDPETGLEIKEKKQGRGGLGRGPLDETKFLFHLLTKNIRSMSVDNQQKENFLRQALNLLEGTYSTPTAENPVAKPIVQGGREKGSTLRKGLYQHTTPLTYAGLMHRYQEQMGENFGNVSPEQHQKMVDEIYDIAHNRESAHLPHAAKSGEYTFSSKGHSELGDESEKIIKSNLSGRLMSSQKIHKKEQEPHTFMEGDELVNTSEEENNINTASILKKLIQKYAFKH